jgi:hypothetical protein
MQFFLSKKDKSYLLVMDSASRSGNLFKVVGEDTWTLIWSGVVTEEFLESPDWEWETTHGTPRASKAAGRSRARWVASPTR